MPQSEADIRASLDAVIEDVEQNQRIFGWFSNNVGDLARATWSLARTVEDRFNLVDERFAQVDQRFAQVDQRFDRVDRELGLLHDSVRTMDARIEKLVAYTIRDETKPAGSGD